MGPSESDSWDELRQEIVRLQRRIAALEQAANLPSPPVEPGDPSETADDAGATGPTVPPESAALAERPPQISIPPPPDSLEPIATWRSPAEVARPLFERSPAEVARSFFQLGSGESWESRVGGRWLTWLGTASMILAVAYFVPWAWRHFDAPAWFRVLLFHLAGVGTLVAAWWLDRKQLAALARGVAGLGIFALYAAAFAMHHHYQLWGNHSSTMTFVDCVLITVATIAVALRADSVAIVYLGALGGYLTPIIASTGQDDYVTSFVYLAFLNVALIACAILRPWHALKPVGVVATAVMFVLWIVSPESDASTLWGTEWLIVLHAAIFLVASTFPSLWWRQASTASDLFALTANSMWFVGITWHLFHESPDQHLAAVCWGMSALHAVLFAWTYQRVTNVDQLPRVQLALATLFLTLAVPLQLRDTLDYLAYAWALEGFILTAIALYFSDRQIARSGTIVLSLALVRAIGYDFLGPATTVGATGWDRRMLVMLLSGIATMAAGSCYWWVGRLAPLRAAAPLDQREGGLLLGVGNLVAMVGLTCQWDSRLVLVLWTLDAGVVWAAALREKEYFARAYALLLILMLVGGRAVYHADDVNRPFQLLWNDRFGSLALVTLVCFVAGWFQRRLATASSGTRSEFDGNSSSLLHVVANVILLCAVSMEVHNWYALESDWPQNISMAEQVTYSVVWAAYAAVLVAAGFVFKYRFPRMLGLLGFLVVALKVFFVDLANLSLILRVLALGVLGAMLLLTSFWYQKFTARLETGEQATHQ